MKLFGIEYVGKLIYKSDVEFLKEKNEIQKKTIEKLEIENDRLTDLIKNAVYYLREHGIIQKSAEIFKTSAEDLRQWIRRQNEDEYFIKLAEDVKKGEKLLKGKIK